jgi:hypothetical protein
MYRFGPRLGSSAFLAGVGEDGMEEQEEEELGKEVEEEELVKEVGRSYVLHWSYRRLAELPPQLLGELQSALHTAAPYRVCWAARAVKYRR